MKNNNSKTLFDNTWVRIILAMASYYITYIAFALIFSAGQNEFIKIRLASVSIKIAMILAACFFTKYIDKRELNFLGLRFEKYRSLKLFFIGCLIVLIQIIFIDSAAYIFKFIEDGSVSLSWQTLFIGGLIFLVHTLFTGIGEEMLFRGYILGNLLTKYNELKAVIISSILFTIIHISSEQTIIDYIDIFIMGIIFAELYRASKSLYLPIGVHFFSDFIQEEVFRYNDLTGNPYIIIKFNISNNFSFGPKIEFLFVITEIIILMGIYFYKMKRKSATLS